MHKHDRFLVTFWNTNRSTSNKDSITMKIQNLVAIVIVTAFAVTSAKAQTQQVYYSSTMQVATRANASYTLMLEPTANNRMKGVLKDAMDQKRGEGEYVAIGKKFIEDGHFIYYHPNGKIESEGEFQRGVKVGTWMRFDNTGKRKQDRYYPAESADMIRKTMEIDKIDEENSSAKK
jgi:antitoxin component YwqK of YwqJK toxin-antitoxin module